MKHESGTELSMLGRLFAQVPKARMLIRTAAAFVVVWVFATTVGFYAGAYAGVIAAYTFSTGPSPLFGMPLIVYVWTGVGAAVGLLQWVLLRRRLQMGGVVDTGHPSWLFLGIRREYRP